MNWESIDVFEDPGGVLQFVESELEELERTGGTAIILGHVPLL